jgi:iron complex outermembrane recepter protein
MVFTRAIALTVGAFLIASAAIAGQTFRGRDLADASIEELLSIQVQSAGKKDQTLGKTAASVYVITAEEIHRSGLRTVPEMLRLAPGVQVARVESGGWAISIRGFNDDFSNKLMVLVDGRAVYNELYGGVFWDLVGLPPDDIDRIEVIRGPSAAMWGANAVNGVINILTKPAEGTQGGLVQFEGGSEFEAGAGARYGLALGPNTFLRVSGQITGRDPLRVYDNVTPASGWQTQSLNFRIDGSPTARDKYTLSGQGYRSTIGRPWTPYSVSNPFPNRLDLKEESFSGDLLGRWQHILKNGSSLEAQVSWTHIDRGDSVQPFTSGTYDTEIRHHWSLRRNDLVWGVNFRQARYSLQRSEVVEILPKDSDLRTYAVFFEDDITLLPDRVHLLIGSHIGHNPFTGRELQPTARLLWTPNLNWSTWLAVSRAIRTPSLADRGLNALQQIVPLVGVPSLGVVKIYGDGAYRSEPSLSYEAGQRAQLSHRFSLDGSVFYSTYQRLEAFLNGPPVLVPPDQEADMYLEFPVHVTNGRSGRSYGADITSSWVASNRVKLTAGYSWIRLRTRVAEGQGSSFPLSDENGTPSHQFQAHCYWDLTRTIQFDTSLYFYGALPALQVPRHWRGDGRLSWRPTEAAELSLGVRDAFDPSHPEFFSTRLNRKTAVHRDIYGAVTWRF